MRMRDPSRWDRRYLAALALSLRAGCGSLLPEASAPPVVYSLDALASGPQLASGPAASGAAPTLIVSPTQAAPG